LIRLSETYDDGGPTLAERLAALEMCIAVLAQALGEAASPSLGERLDSALNASLETFATSGASSTIVSYLKELVSDFALGQELGALSTLPSVSCTRNRSDS
jgi:hypothetical protein